MARTKIPTTEAPEIKIVPLTAQIKVLTIGKRQLTVSIYKQLLEEDIVCSNTGILLGEPWGKVNYHDNTCKEWEKELEDFKHFHIIWSKDGELRKSLIDQDVYKALGKLDYRIELLETCELEVFLKMRVDPRVPKSATYAVERVLIELFPNYTLDAITQQDLLAKAAKLRIKKETIEPVIRQSEEILNKLPQLFISI